MENKLIEIVKDMKEQEQRAEAERLNNHLKSILDKVKRDKEQNNGNKRTED